MFRTLVLPTLIAAAIVLSGATALACSRPIDGWQLSNFSIHGVAEGPFLVSAERFDEAAGESELQVEVIVTNAAGDPVEGESLQIDESPELVRFTWTPSEPLSADAGPYSMNFETGGTELDFQEANLVIERSLAAPTVVFEGLEAEEYAQTKTETCCERKDVDCFDTCGGGESYCDLCWATSYAYPVLVEADLAISGEFIDHRYDVVVRTGPDLETLTVDSVRPLRRGQEGWIAFTGRFEEGASFEHCAAFELEDVITGETTRVGEECITDEAVIPVDRLEPETPDLSACEGSTRFDIDENGTRTERDLEKAEGGCSSTGGSDAGGLALLVVALLGLRRARRRD